MSQKFDTRWREKRGPQTGQKKKTVRDIDQAVGSSQREIKKKGKSAGKQKGNRGGRESLTNCESGGGGWIQIKAKKKIYGGGGGGERGCRNN